MQKKVDELQKNNRPFQIAVLTSVAQVAKRAFSDARNDVGETFSYNDKDPLYVSDEQSPINLSHKGKTGKSKFKTGERAGLEHKTTYFDSYKAFRGHVGRATSAVNWQLTGDLMSDFGSLPIPSNDQPPALGSLKPAVKINPNEYITKLDRDINVKKYGGLSSRYGDFLECSTEEIKTFYDVLEKELTLFLSK